MPTPFQTYICTCGPPFESYIRTCCLTPLRVTTRVWVQPFSKQKPHQSDISWNLGQIWSGPLLLDLFTAFLPLLILVFNPIQYSLKEMHKKKVHKEIKWCIVFVLVCSCCHFWVMRLLQGVTQSPEAFCEDQSWSEPGAHLRILPERARILSMVLLSILWGIP